MTDPVTAPEVYVSPPDQFFRLDVTERRRILERVADGGLDGVFYPDHVSFRNGSGMDGLIMLAGLSQLHPTLGVGVGVYLLPLRHPVLVARQLISLWELAPGRISFGVGVGGEDRHEMVSCEVDPRTRGRRCDEALGLLNPLLAGSTVSHQGEFFHLDEVCLKPVPEPSVPIYVGGRSNAAVTRVARFGQGWIAAWCSVDRFRTAVADCERQAAELGRGDVRWHHQLQPWVGLAANRDQARAAVAETMQRFYGLPFEAFERYVPYGTVPEVAAFLRPYVAAGAARLNVTACVPPGDDAVDAAAQLKVALSG
ncbi:MAG: LLM class flavin-dependent oxidoreductase [Acidimicrobiales bacterium]